MNTKSSHLFMPKFGVGLRHSHFAEALETVADIDFVELHSENFFARGGAVMAVLDDIIAQYPISLHSTALGLGSVNSAPHQYIKKLQRLVDRVNPILMSDHASFCWAEVDGQQICIGDLLPLSFNEQSLDVLANNIDNIQQKLGYQLLIENLSAYVQFDSDCMSETEFLVELTERTGCHLLVDLNNIIVTAHNQKQSDVISFAKNWLNEIPQQKVGEFHLAGFREVDPGEFVIDDHSAAVSDDCWQVYQFALERFGPIPTLMEWDNSLPSWRELLNEVLRAKDIAHQVFSSGMKANSSHE